jgi:hypothetical protein
MSFFNKYVALVADAAGRYATVFVEASNWGAAISRLEDLGCEVVENQTADYDSDDLQTKENRQEVGLIDIDDLLTQTDFLSHG